MKNLTKVLALVLVAATLCLVLASCGKTLSGTYSAEVDVLLAGGKTSFTFSGSKVTLTVTTENILTGSKTNEYKGKYEIEEAKDGTMTITFDFEGQDGTSLYDGKTFSFSEDKDADTITINKIPYTKQK